MLPLNLVPLSDTERAHEARVRDCVVAAIHGAGGWLPFERFMDLVLYAPGLGYYAAGAHKLGAGGDFVTAPEVSPVFGRCLAEECGRVLTALGGGDVMEIGAGTGALAETLLTSLAATGSLPLRYRILDTSPDLRERQRDRLQGLPEALRSRVVWLDRPPHEAWTGVIVANEVLDALPVARVRGSAGGPLELGVTWDADRLTEGARPASTELKALLDERGIGLAEGQEADVCPTLQGWLSAVTGTWAAGVAFFVDYGDSRRNLYTPARPRGTLVAFHRHRQHNDPYVNLGLQDLTAWVDFTGVAEAADAQGLTVEGYTSQACFLLGNGFERHLAALRAELDPGREPLAARAALRLVLPHDMGERFKCMALSRQYRGALGGFSIRDFTATL